ncbi:N-6 DNA methylase [Plesiomonas shigelloides]|uniref:N-6 DNA methylase n=1 Tax=Plesiomonas shigelloides TaxID=703 RepID=UPI00057A70C4|nr:N-6 DNA methylase [Plesiomonas shigelloides]
MKSKSDALVHANAQVKDILSIVDYARGASSQISLRNLAYSILFMRCLLVRGSFEKKQLNNQSDVLNLIDLVITSSDCDVIADNLQLIKEKLSKSFLLLNEFDSIFAIHALRNCLYNQIDLVSVYTLEQLDLHFSKLEGMSGSEFYTPDNVNDLIVSIGRLYQPKKICDPFAGAGNTAFGFCDGVSFDVSVDTQEINEDAYYHILISRFIRGVKGKDYHDDSLANPVYKNNEYDLVVSLPPFNMRLSKELRRASIDEMVSGCDCVFKDYSDAILNSDSSWLIALSMMSALSENGRLIVVMPVGAMHKSAGAKKIREVLVSLGMIETVILLPQRIYYTTVIKTVVVVFRNAKCKDDDLGVRFVDASMLFEPSRVRNNFSRENINTIVDACKDDGRFSLMCGLDEIEKNNFILDPSLYVRKKLQISKLSLQNFRGYESFSVSLNPSLTVLVGENGAGKTSILEALACGLGPFLTAMPGARGRLIKKSDVHIGHNGMARFSRIVIDTPSTLSWDLVTKGANKEEQPKFGTSALFDFADELVKGNSEYPLIAYYGTSRALASTNIKVAINPFEKEDRSEGYESSLDAKVNYGVIKNWFSKIEVDELRRRDELKDYDFIHPAKKIISLTVCKIVERASYIEFDKDSNDVLVYWRNDQGKTVKLALEQLSDGYRNMVALTIDIVRRAYLLNPESDSILDVTGIVLIDEIELHLHPRWQQKIIKDLMDVFKNIQFIVTTHSPQVLTTVKGDCIRVVSTSSKCAEYVCSPYGADSNRALQQILQVSSRPETDVSRHLSKYFELIEGGYGEGDEAKGIRALLESLTDNTEPMLLDADLAIKRVNWIKSRRKS